MALLHDTSALLAPVLDLIRRASMQAVLPRFRHLAASEIREKSPGNLVTDADTEAEKILSEGLTALLPGSLILGEEGVAADPAMLENGFSQKPVWIIDPVDGTRNFANGDTRFGMIVALMIEGEIRAGWLYYPTDDECILGDKDSGVFVKNQQDKENILSFSTESDVDFYQQIFLLSPYGQNSAQKKLLKKAAAPFKEIVGFGCSAQEYRLLLTGRADIGFYSSIWPWDHAAGSFLLSRCGGAVLDSAGKPYCAARNRPDWLVLGRNPAYVRQLYDWGHAVISQF